MEKNKQLKEWQEIMKGSQQYKWYFDNGELKKNK